MTDFKPLITLTQAMNDPALFGHVFASLSFWTWKVVAKLIDGIPLTEPREVALFEQATGRVYNRQARRAARTILFLCGRRAGKDRFLSAIGVWRCALCADWNQYLSAGEQAVVILLGRDKKQAAILRRYCRGLLEVPDLKQQVLRETNEVIEFKNGSSLEIASNDVALVHGRSAIAVLGSEACHWKTGEYAASSDAEVVSAAENSMAMTVDGGLLFLGSSVHRKKGYMFEQYHKHFDEASDDLIWFCPSQVMNPKLPQWVIDRAMAKDPHKANAEFHYIWREDLSECFPYDAVEACIDVGIKERPYQRNTSYLAYQDAASGGGSDSFALAIVHRDPGSNITFLDLTRERKPRFVAYEVIAEWAQILKSYRISEIYGDHYAFQLFADEWRKHNIIMREAESTTSENYLRALPLVLGRRARLLDDATLRSQLLSLERRIVDGHEQVDHPKIANAHDDVATAVCGALATTSSRSGYTLDPFQDDFVDLDRRDASPPETPPPLTADGNWWRHKQHLRSSMGSADDQLRSLYGAVDNFFRYR
jgi:hypothetical protein